MRLLFLLPALAFATCTQQQNNIHRLNAKIDSLQQKLEASYKPGFGEIMLGIQMHHAKLWFAGTNKNWKLAAFEIDEMKEGLEDIQKYDSNRPESKSISMINGAIDSTGNAIQQKNAQQFKKSFIFLTNTCNSCHRATNHEFNVVTIPNNPPVTNQDFRQAAMEQTGK